MTNWFLSRLDPSLAGDLLEERQCGRSRVWFWGQILRGTVTAMGRNARIGNARMWAILAGWVLQVCVAVTILKFHLMPDPHGLLWRLGACAAVLLAAAFYGLVFGLTKVFCAKAVPAEWQTTVSNAADAFFVNLLVCYLFVLLTGFSMAGVLAAELCWLVSDLSRVLLVRHPAAG